MASSVTDTNRWNNATEAKRLNIMKRATVKGDTATWKALAFVDLPASVKKRQHESY